MKLQQLYYFKALAEREHLFQTATELYISPPALSTAISRLEEELGVPLFDRVGRNIRLSENGKKFYLHVTNIINELELACAELKAESPMNLNILNVYTSTNISWGSAFEEFVYRNPHIAFNHQVADNQRLFSGDQGTQPDFIITALSDAPAGQYEYKVLIPNDPPVLAVYEGHRFCGRLEISLREAYHEPFIVPPSTYSIRRYFDTMCDLAGFTPNIVTEADVQLRMRLVKKGMGITLSTRLATSAPALVGLRLIDVVDPVYPRVQVILWRKGRPLSPQAREFLDFMCDYYSQANPGGAN